MTIRPYQTKDRENCRKICHITATAPAYVKNPELVATLYCDYYIDKEPDNCFVLTDEFDNAVGYILCAENEVDFEVGYKPYLDKAGKMSLSNKIGCMADSFFNRKLYKDYPAHLHIDILPAFQGKGSGKQLISTLEAHLRSKNVKGVHLGVGGDNKRAHKFYEKADYILLRNWGSLGKIYGKKL